MNANDENCHFQLFFFSIQSFHVVWPEQRRIWHLPKQKTGSCNSHQVTTLNSPHNSFHPKQDFSQLINGSFIMQHSVDSRKLKHLTLGTVFKSTGFYIDSLWKCILTLQSSQEHLIWSFILELSVWYLFQQKEPGQQINGWLFKHFYCSLSLRSSEQFHRRRKFSLFTSVRASVWLSKREEWRVTLPGIMAGCFSSISGKE